MSHLTSVCLPKNSESLVHIYIHISGNVDHEKTTEGQLVGRRLSEFIVTEFLAAHGSDYYKEMPHFFFVAASVTFEIYTGRLKWYII